MKIKYTGLRKHLTLVLGGDGIRTAYNFLPENGFTVEVTNSKHIKILLGSVLHKFEPVAEEIRVIEKPEEDIVVEKEKPKNKKGKKYAKKN